jgi:ppGpp synthetase/RelA/SpoT-type nucleotidyltranferase
MAEYNYENTIKQFFGYYSGKHDTIQLYTDRVRQICVDSLEEAHIRHAPITSRIKTWESADGKIRRKLKPSSNPTVEDMKQSLRDFGGVRISLYFPGDVEKVVRALQTRLVVERKNRKRMGAPELQDHAVTHGSNQPTFGGYRATHLLVKLKAEEIPKDKAAWKEVEVEIQIGTLVMHVWSEVEHDMIYKPLATQGKGVSDHERRLLDLINGLVMTGEVALRQLEASTEDRLNQRATNNNTVALDRYELASWIEKYHRDKGQSLGETEWQHLRQLYGILKATGDNRHDRIYELLDEIWQPDNQGIIAKISRQTLPSIMLQYFCDRRLGFTYSEPLLMTQSNKANRINIARNLGWRLVHSLSIAIYFGIGEHFADTPKVYKSTPPSLVDFLDLMHPTMPILDNDQLVTTIADFCQVVLDQKREDTFSRICIELPNKGQIVHGLTPEGLSRLVFPGLLLRIFPLRTDTNPRVVDRWDDLRVFDFIDEYIRQKERIEPEDDTKLKPTWLSDPDLNHRLQQPLIHRFFIPRTKPSQDEGRWRLADLQGCLEVKTLGNWKDEYRVEDTATEGRRRHSLEVGGSGTTENCCDTLQMAYRMYPREKRSHVRRAWKTVINVMRPESDDTSDNYDPPDVAIDVFEDAFVSQSAEVNTKKPVTPIVGEDSLLPSPPGKRARTTSPYPRLYPPLDEEMWKNGPFFPRSRGGSSQAQPTPNRRTGGSNPPPPPPPPPPQGIDPAKAQNPEFDATPLPAATHKLRQRKRPSSPESPSVQSGGRLGRKRGDEESSLSNRTNKRRRLDKLN